MKNKALVIYHQVKPGTDCPDGITAAAIAKESLCDEFDVDLLGHSYDMEIPAIDWQSYREIYIVDYSFDKKVLDSISAYNADVYLIDHHKTAKQRLIEDFTETEARIENRADAVILYSNNLFSLIDLAKSGSELTWEYFHGNSNYPGIVAYVGDRDLWKFQLKDSKKINFALSYLRKQLGGEATYLRYKHLSIEQLHSELLPLGESMYQERLDRIVELSGLLRLGMREGFNYQKIIAGEIPAKDGYLISDLAEYLYNNWDVSFVVIYLEGETAVNLRSKKGTGVDVSEIAKQYGGGGHYHAAGFSRKLGEYPIKIEVK